MKDLTGKYEFEFEEGAVVNFSRVTGTRGFSYSVEFTTSMAAIRALAIITEGVAKRLEVPVEHVLCKLAVMLMRPGGQPESQTRCSAQQIGNETLAGGKCSDSIGQDDNPSAPAGHLPLHKGGIGERIATASEMPRNDKKREERL